MALRLKIFGFGLVAWLGFPDPAVSRSMFSFAFLGTLPNTQTAKTGEVRGVYGPGLRNPLRTWARLRTGQI